MLIRLNQIMRGWANYFQHAVCKHTFSTPGPLRVVAGDPVAADAAPLDVEGRPPPVHHPDGRWQPITADGIELFNLASVPVTRYRYRGNTIPNPWTLPNHAMTAGTVESPVR